MAMHLREEITGGSIHNLKDINPGNKKVPLIGVPPGGTLANERSRM